MARPSPACRYYGNGHVTLKHNGGLLSIDDLLSQMPEPMSLYRSNECAVITDAHGRCKIGELYTWLHLN